MLFLMCAEVLKQPLRTSVAIDIADFEDYHLIEKLKIVISVKDFKAIIMHADTLKTSITAHYSHPKRPMRLAYSQHGMQCEFVLATTGDWTNDTASPATVVSRNSLSRPVTSNSSNGIQLPQRSQRTIATEMPPPVQSASPTLDREISTQRPSRPSPPAPRASVNEESLFMDEDGEDDQVLGENNYDEDEGELRWVKNYLSIYAMHC